jgi:tetratricopeptide (TPR) repeat protein
MKKYISKNEAVLSVFTKKSANFLHLTNLKQKTISSFFLGKKNKIFLFIPEGVRLYSLNLFDKAIVSYDMAIKHNPINSEAYSKRGYCLCDLNRKEEALASFDMAIKHNPTDLFGYITKGIILAELNRLEEALASFDMALKHNPTYSMEYNNRGVCLGRLNLLEESLVARLEELSAKLDMAGKKIRIIISSGVFNRKGDCFFKLNRLEEALASYDMAIKLIPNNVHALNNRRILLEKLESK